MREKVIEAKLCCRVRDAGGMCPKLISPGMDGMPDRLILMPGARVAFAEIKAPNQKPRALQTYRHEQLRALGFPVYVVDDLDQIAGIIDELTGGPTNAER